MTCDFAVPPRRYLSDVNDYTDEVHAIFYQHWVVLNKERETATADIDKWCREWEGKINNYADEQKALLSEKYNLLRYTFDEKHKESLELANVYYDAQKLNLFNELRDASQVLTFQIAKLVNVKWKIERPTVVVVDKQMEKQDLDETSRNAQNDARRRRRRTRDTQNNTENPNDTNASSSLNSSTSNSNPTRNRSSSKKKSEKINNQSTDHKLDSKTQATNEDDSSRKCPICFMIFSLHMTNDDRHRHVNEHMIDDQDTNEKRV